MEIRFLVTNYRGVRYCNDNLEERNMRQSVEPKNCLQIQYDAAGNY